jgi:hypothetical protein
MWPLLEAVDRGRWCMIRWGVRPEIVMSFKLWARAWRSVGVGGEHNAWWIKCTWSSAMEVATIYGREGQCSGWCGRWWYTRL